MAIIIGEGGGTDPRSLNIETRKRRRIDNVIGLEQPLEGIIDAAKAIENTYRDTRLISASAVYNCFGLAFAARRTWIMDATEVQKVLDDDGFRPLPWDPRLWGVGDVVLYRTDTDPLRHVAVIVENRPIVGAPEGHPGFETRVVSAWGQSGEYIHPIVLDPPNLLLGKPFSVYSQRILP